MENETEFPVPKPGARSEAELPCVRPEEHVLAVRRDVKQAQDRQQGRLPAAGRSSHQQVLAACDPKRHLRKRMRLDLLSDEHLAQMLEASDHVGRFRVRTHLP